MPDEENEEVLELTPQEIALANDPDFKTAVGAR